MTPIERAFLDDIIQNPGDDTPRLILADWLSENGQEDRAEFIRMMLPHPGLHYCCGPRNPGWWEARWSDSIVTLHACEKDQSGWKWNRGFVSHITCPLAAWREHGPAIMRQHPVEVVTTEKKPIFQMPHRKYRWFQHLVGNICSWEIPPSMWSEKLSGPYTTDADALAALSRALIQWARTVAPTPEPAVQ